MGKEVLVFGAGAGGLTVARELAKLGHQVQIVTPESEPHHRSVYTVSTPDLNFYEIFPQKLLMPLSLVRVLTTDGVDFTASIRTNAMMVNYASCLNNLERESFQVAIERLPLNELANPRVIKKGDRVSVLLDGGGRTCDLVIDASGCGVVSRRIEPARRNENPLVELIYGGTFFGSIKPEALLLIVGPAGGTCWANPSILGEGLIDIVFSAWGWESHFGYFMQEAPLRLQALVKYLSKVRGMVVENNRSQAIFSGSIRSCPAPEPNSKFGFEVGNGPGMGKPTSGDTFRRTIQAACWLAQAIDEGKTPAEFYRQWRKAWDDRIFLGAAIARLASQRQGKLGGVTQEIVKAIKSRKPNWLQDDAERFIAEGKLNCRLLFFMLGQPQFRSFFLNTLLCYIKKWENAPREWSLPDLA